MKYSPKFNQDEFRSPAPHYRISVGSKKILYAYIRKNASSTFKSYINQKSHPKYFLNPKNIFKKMMGIDPKNRHYLSGNMRYFLHPWSTPVEGFRYDAIIFVYRDPGERLFSTFKNKFVDNRYAMDIHKNFEKLTDCKVEDATFADFVKYTGNNFSRLDPHVTPQKSQLWEIEYTPIDLNQLGSSMSNIIGLEKDELFFGAKLNTSKNNTQIAENRRDLGSLYNTRVSELRAISSEGETLRSSAFINKEICDMVKSYYAQDYDMIAHIEEQK